jgi:hypothetical protein
VTTLWYRSPEILMGATAFNPPVDMVISSERRPCPQPLF